MDPLCRACQAQLNALPAPCSYSLALPGTSCWWSQGGLSRWIAESLSALKPRTKGAQQQEVLLRHLHAHAVESEAAALHCLEKLDPSERYQLIQNARPSLYNWLCNQYHRNNWEVAWEVKRPIYPPLPAPLLERLQQWETRHRRRLETRLRRGHLRSPNSLRLLMREPIALAQYLLEQKIESWEAMTITHRLDFARTQPAYVQKRLEPFIYFLEHPKNPPSRARKSSRSKRKTLLREAPNFELLQPEVLKQRLREARLRLSAPAYLLYWLVVRLGITAKVAYGLTLDRVTLTPEGKVMIRPAQWWIILPASLAETMAKQARFADPSWPYADPQSAPPLPIMSSILPRNQLSSLYGGEAKRLRASALYALMRAGQLNRRWLVQVTGVSYPTLTKLEMKLPADIHHLISPARIAARNAALLGTTR